MLIKPSHYDDEGYVVQWLRSAIPSNSLAVVYSLAADAAAREALGPEGNRRGFEMPQALATLISYILMASRHSGAGHDV